MKKHIFTSLLALVVAVAGKAQIYMGKQDSTKILFFSTAPLENITAVNKTTKPVLSTKGDVVIKVSIQGFQFDKALMQEHFNENYMESEKYPQAIFKGKIDGKWDPKKDGVYPVKVVGKLNVHGVEKDRTLDAFITVKGGVLVVDSKFDIALKDHNIAIPEMVFQKIAETVLVTFHSVLTVDGK